MISPIAVSTLEVLTALLNKKLGCLRELSNSRYAEDSVPRNLEDIVILGKKRVVSKVLSANMIANQRLEKPSRVSL